MKKCHLRKNLYKLMVDCLHCKEREWDLVGELENKE